MPKGDTIYLEVGEMCEKEAVRPKKNVAEGVSLGKMGFISIHRGADENVIIPREAL